MERQKKSVTVYYIDQMDREKMTEDKESGVFVVPTWGCDGKVLYSRETWHNGTVAFVDWFTGLRYLIEDTSSFADELTIVSPDNFC